MSMLTLLGLMRAFQNKKGQGGQSITSGERTSLKVAAASDEFLNGEVSQFLNLKGINARRKYFNELRRGAEPIGYSSDSIGSIRDDSPGVFTWNDIQDGLVQGIEATCTPLASAPYKVRYRENENNTRTFKFYDRLTGMSEFVTVNNNLAYTGAPDEWGSLEKAYAVYQERNGAGNWDTVRRGNSVYDVLTAFTGTPARIEKRLPTVEEAIDFTRSGKACIVVSKREGTNSVVANHAYRLMSASEDGTFTLVNPWGIDGSQVVDYSINGGTTQDGVLTFDKNQLATHFSYFGVEG